jgi:hypothetical protein
MAIEHKENKDPGFSKSKRSAMFGSRRARAADDGSVTKNSVQDSNAISIDSKTTNKTTFSRVSKHSKYSRISRIKKRKKFTPGKASAKKIKLEQLKKKSLDQEAKEIYDLYQKRNKSWLPKFDTLCEEHLGMYFTKYKETAFMPKRIRKDHQAQRLFFNKWKILILYFVRHSDCYSSREEVKKYFSFNKVSAAVESYMRHWLQKKFPRQVTNTPKNISEVKKKV